MAGPIARRRLQLRSKSGKNNGKRGCSIKDSQRGEVRGDGVQNQMVKGQTTHNCAKAMLRKGRHEPRGLSPEELASLRTEIEQSRKQAYQPPKVAQTVEDVLDFIRGCNDESLVIAYLAKAKATKAQIAARVAKCHGNSVARSTQTSLKPVPQTPPKIPVAIDTPSTSGNWKCAKCGGIGYAHETECYNCRTPRSA